MAIQKQFDHSSKFREVDGGDVPMRVNTAPMNADRYVDSARVGTHDEWVPSVNPMKPGRIVQVKESLQDDARRAAGAMKHKSVFSNPDSPRNGGDCCSSFYGGGDGPLTRRRGGE